MGVVLLEGQALVGTGLTKARITSGSFAKPRPSSDSPLPHTSTYTYAETVLLLATTLQRRRPPLHAALLLRTTMAMTRRRHDYISPPPAVKPNIGHHLGARSRAQSQQPTRELNTDDGRIAVYSVRGGNSGRNDDALWGVDSPRNDSVSKVPRVVSPSTRLYDSQTTIEPSTTYTQSITSLRTGPVTIRQYARSMLVPTQTLLSSSQPQRSNSIVTNDDGGGTQSWDSTYEKRTESNRYPVYLNLDTFHPPSVAYDATMVESSLHLSLSTTQRTIQSLAAYLRRETETFSPSFISIFDFFADNVCTASR
ncbi:hypothetical protein EV421DRAFT_1746500 [Armillaria borealis]|uniref:Uncharacterized protein n=1 Tax=Armillaria borealis TaxID=47425 RepID=A0AA39IDM2_9AGAR|nr:hypothetical protein EV421DRAFT_1746500 [Armillaria borealis]